MFGLDLKKFQKLVADLPLTMESEHFVVHYGLRNPRDGRGLGAGGVGDPVLVRWYLGALERLYRALTAPPWNRPKPRTDASGKIRVYVCDLDQLGLGEPFTTADRNKVPFIALPCRSHDPLTDSAMRRAAATAVHEATHVFNATERPFHRPLDFPWWAWLNEALATFMESRVLPGNQDYFRFLADWIDEPGVSLNDFTMAYQGCLFLHYLAGRLGPDIVNRVWVDSTVEERPLAAFRRLLPTDFPLADADPDRPDLFASGFAMDAYFLRDHGGGCFAPEISSRFGDRAVAESFSLGSGESRSQGGELPHLATHYYRVFPRRGVDRLSLSVEPDAKTGSGALKVEAAVALSDLSRGKRLVLRPGPNPPRLEGELQSLPEEDLHHWVVVVSNCTLKELPMVPAWDHEPTLARYTIRISAP